MLTITSNAAEVVSNVRQEQGVPDDFGIRVYPAQSAEGAGVQLAFAKEPAAGDAVGDSEGVRIFVASELTEPLSDSVIDVENRPDGRTGLILKESSES